MKDMFPDTFKEENFESVGLYPLNEATHGTFSGSIPRTCISYAFETILCLLYSVTGFALKEYLTLSVRVNKFITHFDRHARPT